MSANVLSGGNINCSHFVQPTKNLGASAPVASWIYPLREPTPWDETPAVETPCATVPLSAFGVACLLSLRHELLGTSVNPLLLNRSASIGQSCLHVAVLNYTLVL